MAAYVPQPIEVPALPGPALLLLILGSYPPRTESTAGRTHRNRHTEPSRPVFPGPSSVFSRRQRRSLKNRHLRSVSEKCGGRRHLQELDELASVQRGNVAIELACRRRANPPARMLAAVLGCTPPSSSSVTPVVFRNELHVASLCNLVGVAVSRKLHSVLSSAKPPRVRHHIRSCSRAGLPSDVVQHRERNVVFSVKSPRSQRDRDARHDLLHEDDRAAPSAARHASHIETQVYFFEVAVKGNRCAEDARVEEQKPDDAHECSIVTLIQLGSSGHERRQHLRIDLESQHRQMTPFSGQKR